MSEAYKLSFLMNTDLKMWPIWSRWSGSHMYITYFQAIASGPLGCVLDQAQATYDPVASFNYHFTFTTVQVGLFFFSTVPCV